MKPTRHIALLIALLFASVTVWSQVRHVTRVNPLTQQPYGQEVYEFDWVDVQPQFPGGEHGLVNFISKTREYPYHAYRNRVQGRVLCSFIIGTDGKVTHAEVIRSAQDETLDREALRVIGAMPRWTPGKIGGRAVPVRVVLPIAFRL